MKKYYRILTYYCHSQPHPALINHNIISSNNKESFRLRSVARNDILDCDVRFALSQWQICICHFENYQQKGSYKRLSLLLGLPNRQVWEVVKPPFGNAIHIALVPFAGNKALRTNFPHFLQQQVLLSPKFCWFLQLKNRKLLKLVKNWRKLQVFRHTLRLLSTFCHKAKKPLFLFNFR